MTYFLSHQQQVYPTPSLTFIPSAKYIHVAPGLSELLEVYTVCRLTDRRKRLFGHRLQSRSLQDYHLG